MNYRLPPRPQFTHNEPMEMRQERASQLARDRLADRGVAATDFRAGTLSWSPPRIGFSGELELSHNLGRTPSGLILISSPSLLSYHPYEKSSWTGRRLKLWMDTNHVWEFFSTSIANGSASATYTLQRPRVSTAGLGATFGIFNGTPGDHPPVSAGSVATSGGEKVSIDFGYVDGNTKAFATTVQGAIITNLHTDDEFVWLVV